ncbi:MAG: hypothetical protein KF863_10650 [Rubrivivax sp.]|nr:hypothetical protein [Rubrivivax sp.]
MRDAFGRLVCCPSRLDRAARVAELRRLGGRLQADADPAVRWLGQALAAWMRDGGRLEHRLGVVPPRGSRATPQRQARQAERDALLLRLAVVAGTDAQALRMLRGEAPAHGEAVALVARLRELQAPRSRDAIGRARHRR